MDSFTFSYSKLETTATFNAITQYFHNNWSEIKLTSCDLILMNWNVGIIHSNATEETEAGVRLNLHSLIRPHGVVSD
jgi:hypothetical protein